MSFDESTHKEERFLPAFSKLGFHLECTVAAAISTTDISGSDFLVGNLDDVEFIDSGVYPSRYVRLALYREEYTPNCSRSPKSEKLS